MENERTEAQNHKSTDAPTHRNTETQTHKSTDVRRMTLELPTKMYEAIHTHAGRLGVRKKTLIHDLLIAGSREQNNFKKIMKELSILCPLEESSL